MGGRDEDKWGSERGADDFPEDVYKDGFSEDSSFGGSKDKWGVNQDGDDAKWDSFAPDESPNYDSSDAFGKETQDTWGVQPSKSVPGTVQGKQQMPQLGFPTQIPRNAWVICPLVGAADLIRGGILGMIFGSLGGVTGGYSSGLRGPMLRQYVVQSARASGMSFSLWLGTFSGAKCSCAVMRGKKDIANSFLGGAAAGLVAALRSRNPRAILITSGVSGVLAAVIDSL